MVLGCCGDRAGSAGKHAGVAEPFQIPGTRTSLISQACQADWRHSISNPSHPIATGMSYTTSYSRH